MMDKVKLLQDEQSPLVEKELNEKSKKRKILETCCLYFCYFCLGLELGTFGPTLLDLEYLTGTQTDTVSYILTGSALSSLVGSVLSGPLVDTYNNWLLLILAQLAKAASNFWLPWTQNVTGLAVAKILSGLAYGFFDPPGNMLVMRIWGSEHGPWMQALHLIFGAGSLLGPLLAEPFLGETLNSDIQETINATMTIPATRGMVTRIWIDYTITGLCFILSVIACIGIYLTSYDRSFRITQYNLQDVQMGLDKKNTNDAPLHRYTVVVFLYLFELSFCLSELTFPNYLTVYVVGHLGWSKQKGAFLTAIFLASYTLSRTVGIVLIKFVKPVHILLANSIGIVLFTAPIPFFASENELLLWVCTAGFGVFIATLFPTAISWTADHITMTGPIMSIVMIAAASGEAIGPLALGALFDSYGISSFAYVIFITSCLTLVSFIILIAGSKITNKLTTGRTK